MLASHASPLSVVPHQACYDEVILSSSSHSARSESSGALMVALMAGNYTAPDVFAGEDTETQLRASLALLAIFNFFQIFGFLSLGIVVLTAWLSPTIHRTPAWYSFMATWMWFCVSYFLIAGQQVGPEPEFGVCVVQASLVYAGPPLTSCASLALLLQLYFTVSAVLKNQRINRVWSIMLLIFPYTIHLLFFLETLALGLSHQGEIARDLSGMFCHLTNSLQAKITAIVVILAMVAMLVYEGLTAIVLYRNWAAFQRLRVRSNSDISLPLIVRVTLFSFLPMVAMGVSTLSLFPDNPGPVFEGQINLVVAFLPAAAAVIFGTQRDILNAWMFWKSTSSSTGQIAGNPSSSVPKDSPV
ncbi:hypothetical protein FB45DRAFT_887245 [Roridomyces roridus]|uniref:Uncharacterized protein n=1 Tax=Roridomyces roridus TaxID=1738132 RepID=A0AAD7FYC7_9AGAR|nr:hypothetical protein FB45DRAFT_887245 [Roridomyces roridus]